MTGAAGMIPRVGGANQDVCQEQGAMKAIVLEPYLNNFVKKAGQIDSTIIKTIIGEKTIARPSRPEAKASRPVNHKTLSAPKRLITISGKALQIAIATKRPVAKARRQFRMITWRRIGIEHQFSIRDSVHP